MNFAIIAQQLVSGMGSSLMIFVLTLLLMIGAAGDSALTYSLSGFLIGAV